ncbi:hypothetical protein M1L60_44905 [Actinoplanes sp. TRM 88003]|uniref:Lipoprotein n=1 Tax=Paractinoplanes aksuensis TaxID=2939490 RepID=A0ABT1E3N6_9ACTN|nr:hypothetical protein [Actinoplanes aksuensis]MCO8277737.1 hypothetical protein [Actinoplanes aksuensis]
MTKTHAVLFVVGAFTVAAGLGACAQPSRDASIDQRAGREVMVRAVNQIFGTPEQRAAGGEGEHYAIEATLADCAERKNLKYTVHGWDPPGIDQPSNMTDLPVLFGPDLADFGIARGFLKQIRLRENAGPQPTEAEVAQSRRFNECRLEVASMDNRHRPAAQYALEQKFRDDQAPIHQELEPRLIGWYSTCMSQAGTPADNMNDAYHQAQRKFVPLIHRSSAELSVSEGWAEAEAFERKTAAADVNCRRANADAVVTASAAAVQTFLDQHREEVDTVAAAWAAMPAMRDAARKAARRA